MKRLAVTTLVLALSAAGGASADDYYDDRGYEPGYGYEPAYDEAYDDRYDGYGYDEAYDPRYDARAEGGAAYDVARVLRVDPIVEPAREVRRQQCWREPAPRYAYEDRRYDDRYGRPEVRRTSGGGAVLGAIVGGALGNTVGSGDGRQAATVLGAVIGGAIGNDIERNGQRRYQAYDAGYRQPVEVERCEVVTDVQREGRVVGYRVAYEYAGRTFETVTDYHPGSELRVRVDVTPEG